MADKKLMVDSTILIDYFRKTDKSKSNLISHFKNYEYLYISSVTKFEVINGATSAHLEFAIKCWQDLLFWTSIRKQQDKPQQSFSNLRPNTRALISLTSL